MKIDYTRCYLTHGPLRHPHLSAALHGSDTLWPSELGCLDAPDFIPAGAVYSGRAKPRPRYQRYTQRPA